MGTAGREPEGMCVELCWGGGLVGGSRCIPLEWGKGGGVECVYVISRWTAAERGRDFFLRQGQFRMTARALFNVWPSSTEIV